MFARRVFHNNSHNVFTDTLVPVLILSFLQYTYTGEDGGSGLTFISSLQFFYYALSLSANNWGYLYFSLLWQGDSFYSLFWKGRVTGLPLLLVTKKGFLRIYCLEGFTFIIGYQSRRF